MPGIKQELRSIDTLTDLRNNFSTKHGAPELNNAAQKRPREDRDDSEDEVAAINRYCNHLLSLCARIYCHDIRRLIDN